MKLLPKESSLRADDQSKGKPEQKKRFLIVKLEERIAPCHTNPHGKQVGCNGGGHHSCYCF